MKPRWNFVATLSARELPLNKPVDVEFTPTKTGEFGFACGMNMLKGKLVVQEGE